MNRFNHVSIKADDLTESATFYEEVLGMERIPAPNFPGVGVEWLRCGDLTLHLFDYDIETPQYYHFGLHVDDFQKVYDVTVEQDYIADFDEGENPPTVYVLPEGAVQMYMQDPADNMVEINYHDVTELPEYIREKSVERAAQVSQESVEGEPRLYFEEFLRDIGAESTPGDTAR